MSALQLAGRQISVDQDGFLCDLTDWAPDVATALALAEGIELTPTHWAVLNALREFYAEFQLSPATRPLVKYIALKLGPETGNSACLNQLFKGTPAKLAAKLAGLPKPTNCI